MNIDGKTLLRNLSGGVQYELVSKLNLENVWKHIADYYEMKECHWNDLKSINAGEAFFFELCDQNFTVDELREACEASQSYELLAISALFQEPVPIQIQSYPLVLSRARSSRRGRKHALFVKEGEELKLLAKATGTPPPKYEWSLDNTHICSNTSGILLITNFKKENEGRYWCRISQEHGGTCTSKLTEDVFITLDKKCDKDVPVLEITAKKALLIANQSYDFDRLVAPASDTSRLGEVLQEKYGFDVIIRKDLTGKEMKEVEEEFWKTVPDNAYVVFYFAGHGFQIGTDLFFMGVDEIPRNSFGFQHALSQDAVIKEGSRHKPSLLLMLCDTCLGELTDEFSTIKEQPVPRYICPAYPGVIKAYATSKSSEAYEDADSGIFTKHLIKTLETKTTLSVSHALLEVRKGVNLETNRYEVSQVPMEVSTAIRCHRLSDPISKRKNPKKSSIIKELVVNRFDET